MPEIHNQHSCHLCGHTMSWAGDICGNLYIGHGHEVSATISVTSAANDEGVVGLGVQLQCPECGAVNQFHVDYCAHERHRG